MVAIYDDIKSLYEILASEHGKIQDVKAKLEHLEKTHGVDRPFIKEVFKTFAIEKMVMVAMEGVKK